MNKSTILHQVDQIFLKQWTLIAIHVNPHGNKTMFHRLKELRTMNNKRLMPYL